jgi:hypothetical protein
MTAARMSAADARRLGIVGAPPARKRTTRKEAHGPYLTRCTTPDCGETFSTGAAETRHHEATGHRRYELVTERT